MPRAGLLEMDDWLAGLEDSSTSMGGAGSGGGSGSEHMGGAQGRAAGQAVDSGGGWRHSPLHPAPGMLGPHAGAGQGQGGAAHAGGRQGAGAGRDAGGGLALGAGAAGRAAAGLDAGSMYGAEDGLEFLQRLVSMLPLPPSRAVLCACVRRRQALFLTLGALGHQPRV